MVPVLAGSHAHGVWQLCKQEQEVNACTIIQLYNNLPYILDYKYRFYTRYKFRKMFLYSLIDTSSLFILSGLEILRSGNKYKFIQIGPLLLILDLQLGRT